MIEYRRQYTPDNPKRIMKLKPRHLLILDTVGRYRVVTTRLLQALLFDSVQEPPKGLQNQKTGKVVVEETRELFHAGYLIKPPEQIEMRKAVKGSIGHVFALPPKGERALQEHWSAHGKEVAYRLLDPHVKFHTIEHDLMISEMRTVITLLTASHPQLKLLFWENATDFKIKGNVDGETRSFYPDSFFAIEHNTQPRYYFYEADKGTMPIERKEKDKNTDWKKKLTIYNSYDQSKGFYAEFGQDHFSLITTTTSPQRRDNMSELAQQFKIAPRTFFASHPNIDPINPYSVQENIWANPTQSSLVKLFDLAG